MREIEFRGRTNSGDWFYGGYIPGEQAIRPKHCSMKIFVNPKTVGQYTGLKDKNGVKIFDGDIVACGDGRVPTQIIWDADNCAYYAYNIRRKERAGFNKHFKIFIREVIGNIHDNPELLEAVT